MKKTEKHANLKTVDLFLKKVNLILKSKTKTPLKSKNPKVIDIRKALNSIGYDIYIEKI